MRLSGLLLVAIGLAGSAASAQSFLNMGCLPAERQIEIGNLARTLLKEQDVDGEIRRWREFSSERSGLTREAHECKSRIENVFDLGAILGGECRATIAKYNSLVDLENSAMQSVQFKQQFIRQALEIERSKYRACP